MNANELRISNLVWYRNKKIVKVSNLGNSFETISLHDGLPYGSDDIEEYHPVELTKEIYNQDIINIDCDEFNVCIEQIGGLIYLMGLSDGRTTVIKQIKYVHELQNIYNWLTSKEIKLKL